VGGCGLSDWIRHLDGGLQLRLELLVKAVGDGVDDGVGHGAGRGAPGWSGAPWAERGERALSPFFDGAIFTPRVDPPLFGDSKPGTKTRAASGLTSSSLHGLLFEDEPLL